MFDLKAVKYKKHIPYLEMLNNARTIVRQLCDGDGRTDYSTVGGDYLRAVGLFATFTDVSAATISEDIDGFMDAWYNKGLYNILRDKTNPVELDAYERAVDTGVERYYAKPALEKLMDRLNGMMDEVNAALKTLPENKENE